jgi:pyridoxal phosphate enzyme (YggS family)
MEVTLDYRKVCLVTKGRNVAQIDQLLLKFPQLKIIGENYYPECRDKFLYYRGLGYECHFLGRLQSNKIKKIVEIADVIQSVDSLPKLLKIEASAADLQKKIKVLLQVNLGDDTKAGIPIAELLDFFAKIPWSELKFVEVSGVMTVGFLADLGKTEAGFRNLANIYEILRSKYPDLNTLSMGMSDDYQLALKQGANLLRLGRYFFEAD